MNDNDQTTMHIHYDNNRVETLQIPRACMCFGSNYIELEFIRCTFVGT